MTKTPVPLHVREFVIDTVNQGFGDQIEMLADHVADEVIDMLCAVVDALFTGTNDDERLMTSNLRLLQLWILNTVVLRSQCKGGIITSGCVILSQNTKFQLLNGDEDCETSGQRC